MPLKGVSRTKPKRTTPVRPPRAHSPFKLVTRKQIDEVARVIVDTFNPEKVILFGSYAYGKPTIDSDVDLLVVMRSKERPARRGMRVASILLDFPFPMDILVRTPTEISRRLKMEDYFLREIVRQGRILYER